MYNSKKKILLIIIFLLACTSCTANEVKKVKVAVIVKSTTSQFFKSVYSGASSAANEYNLELTFVGPEKEEDYQSQITMIERAVNDQVDVIVLSAIDYNKMVEPVEKAIDQGVDVVIIDSDINTNRVATRVSTNNYEAGSMVGRTVLGDSSIGKHVGIVNFGVATANGQEREDGFKKTMKTSSTKIDIDTINVDSNIESATLGTIQLLREHPSINTIVTFNEWTSLGVGAAIEQLGLANDIYVVAFDNNPLSVKMLEKGIVDALIVQNPFAIGYLGVEQAYTIAKGKKVKSKMFYTKTTLITKENMFEKENQKIVFPFD